MAPASGVTAGPAAAPHSGRRRPSFDRSIVEGPIVPAVWKIAWPTVLQNAIGGLQGIVDHALVGHFVGFTGNAAIGVSWQIFLVVIVFISSLFTGMGVLVARAAGANDHDRVNRTVYQAFLTALVLSLAILAPLGWALSPTLLDLVNATPEVRAEALPFLRTMFLFSIGLLMFFMLGGALRAAGDARTPLRLGVAMTVLNFCLNVVLIRGAGPIPAFGTRGAALGTVIASITVSSVGLWLLLAGKLVVHFDRSLSLAPGLHDHPLALPLRAAGRPAGGRDERRRRDAAALHRIAAAQRGGAGGLRGGLCGAVLAHHLDVGWPDGGRGRCRRAEPRRRPARPQRARGPYRGPDRAGRRRLDRRAVPADSRAAAGDLRSPGSDRRRSWGGSCCAT